MSRLLITIAGHEFEVELVTLPDSDGFTSVRVNGELLRIALPLERTLDTIEWAIVESHPYVLRIDHDLHWIESAYGHHKLRIRDLEAAVVRPTSGDGRIKAPIPGLIACVLVEVGQSVVVGQPILILEAMKMQNELVAPRTGQVTTVNIRPGQSVLLNELLVEIG